MDITALGTLLRRHAISFARMAVVMLLAADLALFLDARHGGAALAADLWLVHLTASYVVTATSLFTPRTGAILGLIPLSLTWFTGPVTIDYTLLFITLSIVWTVAGQPVARAITAAYALVLLAGVFATEVRPPTVVAQFLVAGVGCGLGLFARALLAARRHRAERLIHLEVQEQNQWRLEHRALVAQLQGRIREQIHDEGAVAHRAARSAGDSELPAYLARVETSARELLGLLRQLVTSYRSEDGHTRPAYTSVVDLLEAAEDELVGVGLLAELRMGPQARPKLENRQDLVGPLQLVLSTLRDCAQPGSPVRMEASVRASRGMIMLVTQPRPEAAVRLRALAGGRLPEGAHLRVVAHGAAHEIRLDFPLTRGPRWWRLAPRQSLTGAFTALIAAGMLLVTLLSWQQPDVPTLATVGSLTALATSLLLVYAPRVAPPVGILSAIVLLATNSPWLLVDLIVAVHVGLATILLRGRPHSAHVPWAVGLYLTIRFWGWTHLALFVGVAIGGALYVAVLHAQRRSLEDQRIAELQAHIHQTTSLVRERLAGELHDIVAHQLSRIVLLTATTTPDSDLRNTLAQLASALSATEVELDLLVEALASEAQRASTNPTRIASSSAATLADTLEKHGYRPLVELPRDLDELAAPVQHILVRILQESATNILRYAQSGTDCDVHVSLNATCVDVRVSSALSDSPPHARIADLSTGNGLDGLDRSIRDMGGTFEAGSVDGRWVVTSTLPRDPAASLAARPEVAAAHL